MITAVSTKEDQHTSKQQGGTKSIVSEELCQLDQRCGHHEEWHMRPADAGANGNNGGDRMATIPEECATLLKDIGISLNRILASTQSTNIPSRPMNGDSAADDALELCRFYRKFLSCGFCTHASSLLLDQHFQDVKESFVWLTRIHHLLSYVVTDNASSVSLIPVVSQTVALIMDVLPDCQNALLRDWIELSWELVQVLQQHSSDINSKGTNGTAFQLQMTILDDAVATLGSHDSMENARYVLSVYSIEETQQLLYACLNIVLDRFLRHQQQQPSLDLTNTLLGTIYTFTMAQPLETFTGTTAAESILATTHVRAIHLLYWIVSQGYIPISSGNEEPHDHSATTTTPCYTICSIIGHTIHSYVQYYCTGDNHSALDMLLLSTYCNYLLPMVVFIFSSDTQRSNKEQKISIPLILPPSHRRRHPAILLLFQLIDCIPFFMAMQRRKAEKRLIRLIFRIMYHLIVVTPSQHQIDILTHVESNGYFSFLFELLLRTSSSDISSIILYGFLDPLWMMTSNDSIICSGAPQEILENICQNYLQNQSNERSATKRRKSSNEKSIGNYRYNSLHTPPQQNELQKSVVALTPIMNHSLLTSKKRSHTVDQNASTLLLNFSSLTHSLEHILRNAFQYCHKLSSWKDKDTKNVYSILFHEKDSILIICRALRVLMIGGRRSPLAATKFTPFILEAIDKLVAACATCATAISWTCSNNTVHSDQDQQQHETTSKRVLKSLIHVVYTAQHIDLLVMGTSEPSGTAAENSNFHNEYAAVLSNISKNIDWISYVAVDSWRKRENIGIAETSQYTLDSTEELSGENTEEFALRIISEDNSINRLTTARFCNKTCCYISALFASSCTPQDCLCGLITTTNLFYKKGQAILLLESCLTLQARCCLSACMCHKHKPSISRVQQDVKDECANSGLDQTKGLLESDTGSRKFSALLRVLSSSIIQSSPFSICNSLAGLCLYIDGTLSSSRKYENSTFIKHLMPSLERILLELMRKADSDINSMPTLRCCLLSFYSITESTLAYGQFVESRKERKSGSADFSNFAVCTVEKLCFVAGVSPYSLVRFLGEFSKIKQTVELPSNAIVLRDSFRTVLSDWLSNHATPFSRPDKSEASCVRLASFKFLASSVIVLDTDELHRLYSLHDKDIFVHRTNVENIPSANQFSPSALAWILLAPFVENDFVVRSYAACCFGMILQAKSCALIYLLFYDNTMMTSEQDSWCICRHRELEDKNPTNSAGMTRKKRQELKKSVIYRLFSFIDKKMHLHCGIHFSEFDETSIDPQTQYPNGTTPKKDRRVASRANNVSTPPHRASNNEKKSFRGRQKSAISALSSLCQNADMSTYEGALIFQEALLRIVQLSEGQDNLRDIAFSEISRIHSIRPLNEIYSTSSVAKSFLPMLLLELLPTTNELGTASSPHNSIFQYNRIIVFIKSFLLPTGTEYPVDELEYLDSALPLVLPFFITNKDYQALVQFTLLRLNVQTILRGNSPSHATSVPDIREEIAKICAERGIIEQIVVRCLLHHNLSPFSFLLNSVFCSPITLKKLLAFREQLVLKMLIWELAGANLAEYSHLEVGLLSRSDTDICMEDCSIYDPTEVICALKKGAWIRSTSCFEDNSQASLKDFDALSIQLQHEHSISDENLTKWINDSFMYLLVNIAAVRQNVSSVRPLQCLCSMLNFLNAAESPQYIPQIMSIVNTAMNHEQQNPLARLLAVKCLTKFVKILLSYQINTVGENLSTIVVSLFPVLNRHYHCDDADAVEAVSLLESLVEGNVGISLASCFQEVPFLPCKPELDSVRQRLRSLGVDLDRLVENPNISLTCTQTSSQTTLNDYLNTEESEKIQRNVADLYKRILIVTKLIQHESTSVRKAFIDHAVDVLHHNREAFSILVDNEEVGGKSFLTVAKENEVNDGRACDTKKALKQDGVGVVSFLVQTLLHRFVLEQDAECRISLATLAGEIGAIDPNTLQLNDTTHESSAVASDSEIISWNLSQPPWKADLRQYSLQLITSCLVPALKSSPTTQDQHKVAFAIQECLTFLDSFETNAGEGNVNFEGGAVCPNDIKASTNRGNMSTWIRIALSKAGVLEVVEPFWSTSYKQLDTASTRSPPFAKISSSYYQWISTFCRFLIEKSQLNTNSSWKALFHSCRSAIRSQAGLHVAEILLPPLVVEVMCLGDPINTAIIVQEFVDVLNLEGFCNGVAEVGPCDQIKGSKISKEDQLKAVNTVLTCRDTIESWVEGKVEEQFFAANKKEKRLPGSATVNLWPLEVSVDHMLGLLKQLPLLKCAFAASAVGMHARALRFLEIDIRESVVEKVFCDSSDPSGTREEAQFLVNERVKVNRRDDRGPGGALAPLKSVTLQSTQYLFGCLFDCDAMQAIVQESVRLGLSRSVEDQIREKEVYGDWNGALRGYEQALQLHTHEKGPSDATGLEAGMLHSLLELGQLESVVNQVRGLQRNEVAAADPNIKVTYSHKRIDLIPLATEAAWRLGRWELLEELISDKSCFTAESSPLATYNPDAHFQFSIGKAMLAMHHKSKEEFHGSLHEAKCAVTETLSSSARDSYSRAYPSVLRLHCIREMEDVSQRLFCSCKIRSRSQMHVHTKCKDCLAHVWNWESRLERVSSEIFNLRTIVNTRVALMRLLNSTEDEGSLWLELGKRERKQGLTNLAETSLAHAEAAFAGERQLEGKVNGDSILLRLLRQNEVQMQIAKLKHATGDASSALRMIEPVEITAMTLLQADEKELKSAINNFILRLFCDNKEIANRLTSEEIYKEGSKIFGRRLLLATDWMVGLKGGAEIMDRYRLLQRVSPSWEKAHVTFATYLDSLFEARQTAAALKVSYQMLKLEDEALRAKVLRSDTGCQKFLIEAMSEYGKALCLSDKHLYQALPRLLQLWFEFTSIDPNTHSDSLVPILLFKEKQRNANDLMSTLAKDIPPHQFYSALPQLMSRIGHRDQATQKIVKSVLKRVLSKYPEQAMWGLAWLIHSKDAQRRLTGEEIFLGAQTKLSKVGNIKMHDLLAESRDLFKWLVELAQYQPKDHRAESVHIRPWKGSVSLSDFVPPVQAALTLSSSVRSHDFNKSHTSVFPTIVPRMRCFSSKIKVMLSKARPKRLTAYIVPHDQTTANDNKSRNSNNELQSGDIGEMHFLVKQEAKGDLRKDARLQDLNIVINRLLTLSGKGRHQRRRLHLRTFSVVCLSEDSGILQWVPNTVSLRSCVAESFNPQADPRSIRRRGARIAKFQDVSLREKFEKCQEIYFKHGNLTRATALYEEQIIQAYPPVLYWWFINKFQDSHSWFEARTRFTLSAAVWSAVGFVIGLGDRHSENILIDTQNGECVHVDFDCIFDKGLNLPKPEVIPFRLTPNMIDTMGPTGWEGTYHGGITNAMNTLRFNRATLLSVLEPFLKDPVIDWKRQRTSQKDVKSNSDASSLEAKRSIKVIDERLRGVYNLRNPNSKKIQRTDNYQADPEDEMTHILPLSVEGQVLRMINEATSHENHVQLYIGWMPWV